MKVLAAATKLTASRRFSSPLASQTAKGATRVMASGARTWVLTM